jgi:TRAP-type C4-dicarboxylate transport system permease small subunit
MIRVARWYKVGFVVWACIIGVGFILAVMWGGWEAAMYGFFIRISTESWPEMAVDILQKIINYLPLIALPFAFREGEKLQ